MKISISGVSAEIKRLNKLIFKERQDLLQIKVKEMRADLANNTPVDTGEAQAGWIDRVEGDHFIIENNVDHIESLNAGHSKQAPAFFIEQTLAKYGDLEGVIKKSP